MSFYPLKTGLIISFYSIIVLHATVFTSDQLRSGLSQSHFFTTLSTLTADKSDDGKFWYWLNIARIQQANGDFTSSIQSFETAYAILDEYENRASISLRNIGAFVGSSLMSKGSETYYGKGYERTLMHTLNALNYIMLNDFEGAAVEMRRMEQRQEFWLKESEAKLKEASEEKEKARRQGNDTSRIPTSYSLASMLEDEEVRNLANNYQDPFSYTLSSIIMDISGQSAASGDFGEVSLKRALSLNPDVSKVFVKIPNPPAPFKKIPIDNSSSLSPSKMDVTVIVLAGEAPALKIEKIRFPLFNGANYTSVDLPSYASPINDINTLIITTNQLKLQPPRLLKTDIMAYKTLKDELPGELAKSVVRATTKAIASKQASDHYGNLGGLVASLLFDVGSTYADSGFRNWEMMPNSGYITKFEAINNSTVTIKLNNAQESFMLPPNKKGTIVLINYLTPDNIRIDHVSY
jgi:hypothetical protein